MRRTLKVFLAAFLFALLVLPMLSTATQAADTDLKIAMTGVNCKFVQSTPDSMDLLPISPDKPMGLVLTDGSKFVEMNGQLYVVSPEGETPMTITNNSYKIVAPNQLVLAKTAPTNVCYRTTIIIIIIVERPDSTDVIIIVARSAAAAN